MAAIVGGSKARRQQGHRGRRRISATPRCRRKVVLIVDNLKVHKAGKVQARVESHAHEIELCYLPSYAPDHNPVEHLNNDLKQKLRQQPQPDTKEELVERTRSVLRVIQRSPERVRAYFKPEPVRYAA